MKNLIIIGARGYGREVYNLAIKCLGFKSEYIIKGFLDDKSDALFGFNNYPDIICSVEDYVLCEDDVFICALGDVRYKKHYAEIIISKGGEYINLIHPNVEIDSNTKLGMGCIISNNTRISCDINIGDFVSINSNTVLGHDTIIGNFVHIGAFSFFGGGSSVGDLVTIHPRVSIIPKKRIDEGSTVGIGSVVLRNVKSGITVMGNPAKKIIF